jgi:hypothetical protein
MSTSHRCRKTFLSFYKKNVTVPDPDPDPQHFSFTDKKAGLSVEVGVVWISFLLVLLVPILYKKFCDVMLCIYSGEAPACPAVYASKRGLRHGLLLRSGKYCFKGKHIRIKVLIKKTSMAFEILDFTLRFNIRKMIKSLPCVGLLSNVAFFWKSIPVFQKNLSMSRELTFAFH